MLGKGLIVMPSIMKRCFATLLVVVVLAMAIPLTAGADVLIEPKNEFFERNSNDIVYLRRDFYVNGRNGFVTVVTEPGSKREIGKLENGGIYQIQYTYNHNGGIWGVIDVEIPGRPYQDWKRGWAPMDDFLVVYDSISFEEDFQDELFTYTGSIDALLEAQELVFWKWPGSGIIIGSWDESVLNAPEMDFWKRWDEFLSYIDREGRQWIAPPSMIHQWICLSDPSNRNIPAFNPAPEPAIWQPGDGHLQSPGGLSLLALIIILVVALAAVTAVLIRVFWRKHDVHSGINDSQGE